MARRLRAFVRNVSGELRPFLTVFEDPVSTRSDAYVKVFAPEYFDRAVTIYGVDADQAVALSRTFICRLLEYDNLVLCDKDGHQVDII